MKGGGWWVIGLPGLCLSHRTAPPPTAAAPLQVLLKDGPAMLAAFIQNAEPLPIRGLFRCAPACLVTNPVRAHALGWLWDSWPSASPPHACETLASSTCTNFKHSP